MVSSDYIPINYDTVKAIWISQFDMYSVYTENGVQRNENDYKAKISAIINNICDMGVNTVYFQLRPNGDSISPSEIFPPSKYVVGRYGGVLDYDPFGMFLELAHEKGISVHGWINPLRCMRTDEINNLSEKYILKQWYNTRKGGIIVAVNDVCYLDSAYPEVIDLICDGVEEIITKYEVDGIHIDDYFYPTTDETFDLFEYSQYKSDGGILCLDDFRRSNINNLIQRLYATVKSRNSALLFGVSPSGNISRNYNELYADVAKWCANEGFVDYICPQIYFGFEHSWYPFDKVCDDFSKLIKSESVDLIIGMTLGKAVSGYLGGEDIWAGDGKREWIENTDVLSRSLEYTEKIKNCSGVAFFSYQYFYDPISSEPIAESAKECSLLLPLIKEIK